MVFFVAQLEFHGKVGGPAGMAENLRRELGELYGCKKCFAFVV